jgi:hypothetical protein
MISLNPSLNPDYNRRNSKNFMSCQIGKLKIKILWTIIDRFRTRHLNMLKLRYQIVKFNLYNRILNILPPQSTNSLNLVLYQALLRRNAHLYLMLLPKQNIIRELFRNNNINNKISRMMIISKTKNSKLA